MIIFWPLVALLIAMAVYFVVRPLTGARLRSDDQVLAKSLSWANSEKDGSNKDDFADHVTDLLDNQSAKAGGGTQLLALVFAGLIPLIALWSYSVVGTPDGINFGLKAEMAQQQIQQQPQQQQSASNTAGSESGGMSINDSIQSLLVRLAENPDDESGWLLLGRAYATTENFEGSVAAFRKALEINADPLTKIDLAESLLFNNGDRRFPAEAKELLLSAVYIQPDAQKGLWLLGLAHQQDGELDLAREAWTQLIQYLPDDSSVATAVQEQINKLAAPALDTTTSANANDSAKKAATSEAKVTITVDISSELREKLKPSDTLFVYAKALQGRPIPLAAVKQPVSDFPITIVLDDSSSMMPQLKLSSVDRARVGARVSHAGGAIAQQGDFEAITNVVNTKDGTHVILTIDQVKQ